MSFEHTKDSPDTEVVVQSITNEVERTEYGPKSNFIFDKSYLYNDIVFKCLKIHLSAHCCTVTILE